MPSIDNLRLTATVLGGGKYDLKVTYTAKFTSWEVTNKAQFTEVVQVRERDGAPDVASTVNPNTAADAVSVNWNGGDDDQKATKSQSLTATGVSVPRTVTFSGVTLGDDGFSPDQTLAAYVFLEPHYRAASRRSTEIQLAP